MRTHEIQIRALYAHTDKAGVVYHANYLAFFEAARTELIRAAGRSYADLEREGILLTVVEAHCKYHAPAFYDDLLTVTAAVTRLRRTRIDFAYEVRNESGRLLCEGMTVLGCLDGSARRPCELPAALRDLFETDAA